MQFLFTSREYLPQLDLYDYRNRIYSADLGRFVQTDPIRFDAGDVNIYRYVFNNPLRWVDPTGLCSNTTYENAYMRSSTGSSMQNLSMGVTGEIDRPDRADVEKGLINTAQTLETSGQALTGTGALTAWSLPKAGMTIAATGGAMIIGGLAFDLMADWIAE